MTRFTFRATAIIVALAAACYILGIRPDNVTRAINQAITALEQQQAAPVTPPGEAPLVRSESGKRVLATDCTFALVLDPAIDKPAAQQIREAARIMTKGSPFTITVTRRGPGLPVTYDDLSGNTAGTAQSITRETSEGPRSQPLGMILDPAMLANLSPEGQLNVYMHEIGHLMGLAHSPHIESVMYKYVNHVTEITHYETRALKRAARACSP